MYLFCKIKNTRIVHPTLSIDLIEVIYFQLSEYIITSILLTLFVITFCALVQSILNPISFIFHIFFGTKPNHLTNL